MSLKRPSSKNSTVRYRWQRCITRFLSTLRRIRRRDQLLALLLLLVWIVLLLGNFYIRGVSRFEGSLITQTMNFTYVGEIDKQFLNSLGITKLALQGKQPSTLNLKGKFSSADPTLNTKLKSLAQLDIQLSTPDSGLTLEDIDNKQTNSINLQQLRIQPNTQVKQLTYRSISNQLSFCLQSDFEKVSSQKVSVCENRSAVEPNLPIVGELKFGVNPTAINLFLSSAQIPALNITESTLETQLRWLPEGQDFILPISSRTSMKIGLPRVSKNTTEEDINDLTQFMRGDISVKQVRFDQRDRSANVNDPILTSEILDGEVRMMGQSLKLQPRQFLIIPTDRSFDKPNCRMSPSKNPGIQRIRDIRLNLKEPKGLQTLVSGESKCLAIGLYQEFPNQSIEPSWLLNYLPQEGINAIYTLIGAFTGILFPRLFPDEDEPRK
ncbi:MAG: hypothetical protein HC780_24035 [Leptolyngbyaceae cyanobacterium CSU_1_3]|nr:hypothetical protein [Leptolyngbyaceae cyanobacterium CSU_1_3]